MSWSWEGGVVCGNQAEVPCWIATSSLAQWGGRRASEALFPFSPVSCQQQCPCTLVSGKNEVKGSIIYNTVPLQIKCKNSIRPIKWMWSLIFDAKFRISLNRFKAAMCGSQ